MWVSSARAVEFRCARVNVLDLGGRSALLDQLEQVLVLLDAAHRPLGDERERRHPRPAEQLPLLVQHVEHAPVRAPLVQRLVELVVDLAELMRVDRAQAAAQRRR